MTVRHKNVRNEIFLEIDKIKDKLQKAKFSDVLTPIRTLKLGILKLRLSNDLLRPCKAQRRNGIQLKIAQRRQDRKA